jgi:hypothetical protein
VFCFDDSGMFRCHPVQRNEVVQLIFSFKMRSRVLQRFLVTCYTVQVLARNRSARARVTCTGGRCCVPRFRTRQHRLARETDLLSGCQSPDFSRFKSLSIEPLGPWHHLWQSITGNSRPFQPHFCAKSHDLRSHQKTETDVSKEDDDNDEG